MYNIFKKIFSILNLIKKNKFSGIILLSVIRSFFEILSLGLLIPVLAILSNFQKDANLFGYNLSFVKRLDINELLILFITVFLISYLFKTLFIGYYEVQKLKKCKDINDKISNIFITNYLNKDYIFFINKNYSELIRNISSEVNLFSFGAIGNYINIIATGLIIIFYCVFLIFYNFKTIYVILIIFVLSFISIIFSQKKFKHWGNIRSQIASKLLKIFDEMFLNIKMIKIFNLEENFKLSSTKPIFQLSESTIKRDLYLGMSAPVIEFISVLFFFIFLILLTSFYKSSYQEILVLFGIIAFASLKLLPSIINLIKSFQQIKYLEKNINIIYDDLKFEKCNHIKENFQLNNIFKIKLQNVKFFYKPENLILDDINIEIKANDKLGIIGKTGSGKSTLLNILCGLLEPNHGTISINDKDYKKINFYNIFSYVPQNIYLFDNSILYNITFQENEKNCNMDRFYELLDAFDLQDIIKNNEDGIHANLGQKGIKISGGQAQRIGLARALYAKFSILVLDESTSSLDEQTEKIIIDKIDQFTKNKIVIFATHRKQALKHCNKIVEVNNKKLLEY